MDTCFIFLDPNNKIIKCSTINCNIYFHANCIKFTNVKCPYCKVVLFNEIYNNLVIKKIKKSLIFYSISIFIYFFFLLFHLYYKKISNAFLVYYALLLFCSQFIILYYYCYKHLYKKYIPIFWGVFCFNLILLIFNFYILFKN